MMFATRRFRIADFLPAGHWFHLAGGVFTTRRAIPQHTHDFPEVFWVTEGAGEHLVNDTRQPLTLGDVVLVRPADRHSFVASRGGSLAIMNLAFRDETRRFIHERYFDPSDAWVWSDDAPTGHHSLDLQAFTQLRASADRLSRSPQSRLALESFLLELLGHLTLTVSDTTPATPPWLLAAIRDMDDGERLRGGPGTMAEVCGRSVEHLNRVVRQHFDCTTTDLINRLRLDRAARLLRVTSDPIPDIAFDAGYENLGYFYRRFGERYRQTPRSFRRKAQSLVQ